MTETPEGGVTVEAQEWRKGDPMEALIFDGDDGQVVIPLLDEDERVLAVALDEQDADRILEGHKAEQEVRELRERLEASGREKQEAEGIYLDEINRLREELARVRSAFTLAELDMRGYAVQLHDCKADLTTRTTLLRQAMEQLEYWVSYAQNDPRYAPWLGKTRALAAAIASALEGDPT